MARPPKKHRRRFLRIAGTAAVVGITGCLNSDGEVENGENGEDEDEEGEDEDEEEEMEDEELPEGVSEEEFVSGPVPDEYLTAVSLGGEERGEDLHAKADVRFSEYDEATEDAAHQPGRSCANCADYIPDKNGDGFGACAEVEGYIGPEDWCSLWEELPEPETPEGMTEEELATAEVPEEYRTATSQGGEERESDDLRTQEEVSLMESVDAAAEGMSPPGRSCGNCADYIPDKNGDGWGACAEVEGYIAVEDWCSIWESLSEHEE
ncbi:MAG: high-potential iron-sulfur protein [Halobacteriales archaeon]|nr:high-potential iron-sulfur protein [Halobacteriales archaeon]